MMNVAQTLRRGLGPATIGLVLGLSQLIGGSARALPVHPSAIVAGTCDSLGDVAFALGDVGASTIDNTTPDSTRSVSNTGGAIPVEIGMTTVSSSLADLVGTDNALTISLDAANSDAVIACGNLGSAAPGGDLVVGLQEVQGSSYSGIAWLHPNGDQTNITVFLAKDLSTSSGNDDEDDDENDDDQNDDENDDDDEDDDSGFIIAPRA